MRENQKFKHFMTDILGSFDNDFNKLIKDLESAQQQQATPIAAK